MSIKCEKYSSFSIGELTVKEPSLLCVKGKKLFRPDKAKPIKKRLKPIKNQVKNSPK